jgi:hypothetical protein
LANLERPLGIAGLRKLLARREHQAFLDELLFAIEDATASETDFLRALGGEGLHLLLADRAPTILLSAYADLLLAGKIHAPVESITALHERFPSVGVDSVIRREHQDGIRAINEGASGCQGDQPTIQLRRVIQLIDMSFGDYSTSDALGIRRSVFRSEQERTFLQALTLRFPGLHAFPNYPLDQLADFDKLRNLLDDETLLYGRQCRVDAVLVIPGEGDPVAAFQLDSLVHDDPAQARRDRLRNRLFRTIQIPLFRLQAEECSSVGVDEWYALLTEEVADKVNCGRRIRIRTTHSTLVPT